MKFNSFKEFRSVSGFGIDEIVAYLRNDLSSIIRDLNVGLSRLSFTNNFQSFSYDVSDLASGEEIQINSVIREGKSRVKPRFFLVVFNKKNGQYLVNDVNSGDTAWTEEYVYLRNSHPSATASAKVMFFL